MYKILIVYSFFLWSCAVSDNTQKVYINDDFSELRFEDFLNINKVTSLEVINGSGIIANQSKLSIIDSSTFLLDNRMNLINKYNISGAFEQKFQRKGRANNEYLRIEDFSYDGDNLYILTYPSKIFVTDYNFNITKIIPLKSPYNRIICFKNQLLLYNHYEREIVSYNINSQLINSLVKDKRDSKKIIMYPEPVFHKINEDSLFICMSGSDNIYLLSNQLEKKIVLDYENKENNYSAADKLDIDDIVTGAKYAPPHIIGIVRNGGYIYISYSFKMRFRYLCLDHNFNLVKDFSLTDTPYFISPRFAIDNVFYAFKIIDNIDDTSGELLTNYSSNGVNQYLFYCKMK